MDFQSLIFLKTKALRNTLRFYWICLILFIILFILFFTIALPVVQKYVNSFLLLTNDSTSYDSPYLFEPAFIGFLVFAILIGFAGSITVIVLTVRTISLKNLIYPAVMNSQNSSSSFIMYDAYKKLNFASKMFIFMWIPLVGAILTLFGILVLVSLFKVASATKTLLMIQFSSQQNNYQQNYYNSQYEDDYQDNNYSQNNSYQHNAGYPQNNRVPANKKNSKKRNNRY
ncbi:hypothetical protein [Mycoplasma sp. 1654_15]|uniref:hypothetical protein n=1 Tax=Mycoplasma sp. 1654_15 TaxID=2725994 RepID=UPI0020C555C2|nr:hypothetical protein [Mycoplasma sp. 1654_15]